MKTLILPCLLFLILVIVNSCTSTKQPALKVPSDLVIAFGSGGGFTGLWNGYTLSADGNLYKWKGNIQEQNPVFAGKLPVSIVEEVWSRVQSIKFMDIKIQEPDNYSCWIRLNAEGKSNYALWNQFRNPEANKDLNDLLIFLVQSASKTISKNQ